MTLAGQIAWKAGILAAAVVAVGGVGVWASLDARRNADRVRTELEGIREIERALGRSTVRVADARRLVEADRPDLEDARPRADRAWEELLHILEDWPLGTFGDARIDEAARQQRRLVDSAVGSLRIVCDQLSASSAEAASIDMRVVGLGLRAAQNALNQALAGSGQLAQDVLQHSADRAQAATLVLVPVSLAVIVAALGLSIWQSRSVVADLERRIRDKSAQLARSERLASVGYLAAVVSHEINNPLGIITGYAESGLRLAGRADPPAPAEVTEALEIIREEAFRCKEITAQLLALSRESDAAPEPVAVAAVVDEVARVLQGLEKYAGRRIDVRGPDDDALLVRASPLELKQAVMNLAVNALQAIEPGGGVTVERDRVAGQVRIAVHDDGRGMSRDVRERVFEPFFTHRRPHDGAGVGLGLAITQAIVERHGGRITADSAGPGKGASFVITLPALDSPHGGGSE